MGRLTVSISKRDFECPVTYRVFFDPVVSVCDHHIERSASTKLQKCPCCNNSNPQFKNATLFFKNTLHAAVEQNKLYEEVYFDLNDFEKIVRENKLDTPTGRLFINLLQNAATYLNRKEDITIEQQDGTTTAANLNAVAILSSTLPGRILLRKKLSIESESSKYFFCNAEISAESLQIEINGKKICEWLSMTTDQERELKKSKQRMDVVLRELQIQFRPGLFSKGDARGAAAISDRNHSDTVNPILQQVVYGEESKVKAALEAVKSNTAQLSALLSDTGTVKDYSNCIITGKTLLQTAASSGDIEMCEMLKNYMDPEEFSNQMVEIFPEGIEAHEAKQQQDAFNFDVILQTLQDASATDIDAVLNRTNNDSALYYELDLFRRQFTQISHDETIFNPYHLLRAYDAYKKLWDQSEHDNVREYGKHDLFWRQIIGYVQRFVSACYAQAFVQGLLSFVKVYRYNDSGWRPKTLERNLKFKDDSGYYFSADPSASSSVCTGLGFDFAIFNSIRDGGEGIRQPVMRVRHLAVEILPGAFQKLLSSKNSELAKYYPAQANSVTPSS